MYNSKTLNWIVVLTSSQPGSYTTDPARPASQSCVKTPPPMTQAQDGGEIIRDPRRRQQVLLAWREIIAMGSTDSKLNFRKAVIQLTTKTQVTCAATQRDEGAHWERERGRERRRRRRRGAHHLRGGEEITFFIRLNNTSPTVSCCIQHFKSSRVYPAK